MAKSAAETTQTGTDPEAIFDKYFNVDWVPDMRNFFGKAEAQQEAAADVALAASKNAVADIHALCSSSTELAIAILAETARDKFIRKTFLQDFGDKEPVKEEAGSAAET